MGQTGFCIIIKLIQRLNEKDMIKRLLHIIFMIMVFLITGCVKETYDMNKISGKVHLSPSLAFRAISGDFTLSDMVKSNDTIVFDENKLVKIIFKQDSVINMKLLDLYDLNDMVSFNQTYPIGELSIASFYETMNLTLNQISMSFSDPLIRAQFVALDGTTNNFPSFPSTSLDDITFPLISNFEYATFLSGTLEISIKNNLPAPLEEITVQLYNSSDYSPVGNQATIAPVDSGALGLATIDLAGVTITNSIVASIVLSGCQGTSDPVLIDLDGSNIEAGIRGKDLKVQSGRVVLPYQTIETLDNRDTISFDPGDDIEIDSLKITSGLISYNIQSLSPIQASFGIILPTMLRSGVALSEIIEADPGTSRSGTLVADNTVIDLGTDTDIPYNRVPMEYSIDVSSDGSFVDFNMDDEILLEVQLIDPDFDFVKGYFGQKTKTIDSDSIDLDIEDILSNSEIDFFIASPSIRLDYYNSFAIPMRVSLDVTGKNNTESVDLGYPPFIVASPEAPESRDISESLSINKDNSALEDLISMPPDKISFSGSAEMNFTGNNGERDNYVFGNSRFLGNLEIEVPLEFSMNLHFADTVDNFFTEAIDAEDDFNWDDFDSFEMVFNIDNGFPVGISLSMILYDSINTPHDLGTVEADPLIDPAPVDGEGKVAADVFASSSTSIVFTHEFFNSIQSADKVILKFTLNTTDNEVVKIYSDYRIKFNASLILKSNINVNLK